MPSVIGRRWRGARAGWYESALQNAAARSNLEHDIIREQIEHFFTHYKDLEKGKWAKVLGWEGVEKAKSIIMDGVNNAQSKAA